MGPVAVPCPLNLCMDAAARSTGCHPSHLITRADTGAGEQVVLLAARAPPPASMHMQAPREQQGAEAQQVAGKDRGGSIQSRILRLGTSQT
jgi:hypothetical protein